LAINILDVTQEVTKVIKSAFEDDMGKYEDGFVEKLEKHHQVIDENLQIIVDKWEYVVEASKLIYQTLSTLDEKIAENIMNGNIGKNDLDVSSLIKPTQTIKMSEEFAEIESATLAKEQQIETGYKKIIEFFEPHIG